MKETGRVYTETGLAILFEDGSMKLNNSGYIQRLNKEQVEAAWNGDPIPYNEEQRQEILDDYDGDESMVGHLAEWNGGYWDFGEELHIIPKKQDFHTDEEC